MDASSKVLILILVRNNTGGLPIQVKQVTFTPT